MNYQGVSEIFFEESYTVPADQTAKALFARLPHGNGYAERLIECLGHGVSGGSGRIHLHS